MKSGILERGLEFLFYRWTGNRKLKRAITNDFNLLRCGWETILFYSPAQSKIYWTFYKNYSARTISEIKAAIKNLAEDAVDVGCGPVDIGLDHLTIPLNTIKISLLNQEYVR